MSSYPLTDPSSDPSSSASEEDSLIRSIIACGVEGGVSFLCLSFLPPGEGRGPRVLVGIPVPTRWPYQRTCGTSCTCEKVCGAGTTPSRRSCSCSCSGFYQARVGPHMRTPKPVTHMCHDGKGGKKIKSQATVIVFYIHNTFSKGGNLEYNCGCVAARPKGTLLAEANNHKHLATTRWNFLSFLLKDKRVVMFDSPPL